MANSLIKVEKSKARTLIINTTETDFIINPQSFKLEPLENYDIFTFSGWENDRLNRLSELESLIWVDIIKDIIE